MKPFTRRVLIKGALVTLAIGASVQVAQAATITKSIGSAGGRDYSTIQAFINALPANLVTDGNSYVGECYNDSEFTGTSDVVTIGAHTTDASHTLTLTAASGQSFQDNASVRSNALRYNVTNGVGVRKTDDYGSVIILSGTTNFLTISRLQLSKSATGAASSLVNDNSGAGCTNLLLKDLLGSSAGSSGNGYQVQGGKVVNVLFIARSSNAVGGFKVTGTASTVSFIGCAAIRSSDKTPAGTAFDRSYGTPILTDSCSFGFTTASNASYSGSSGNNATDLSSIAGSSNQTSVTFNSTTPFTNAADATLDLRSIASTALAGNGVLDSTNAPNDISAYARPASPTIGVWQITVAAAGTNTPAHGSTF